MQAERIDYSKRNFIYALVEGAFYYTGYTFFDVYIVIPVFIDALTGDLRLAGLAVTLKLAFYFLPQLMMGHFTPRLKNLPFFVGIAGFCGRAGFFIVPLVLLTGFDPYIKVFALYLALMLGSLGDGLTHVPWLDILGRTIPGNIRGKLLGYQQLFGGIGGLAAGYMIKIILAGKGTSISSRYALLFFWGAALLAISGALLSLLKDNRNHTREKRSILSYLSGLHRHVAGNKAYTRFIITQCLFYFNGLAAPLYVLFAKKNFNLDEKTVTTLMFIQIIGSLAGGMLWGNLSQKKGNKVTIQVSILVNLLVAAIAASLVFAAEAWVIVPLVVVLFGAGTLLGAYIGYTNYLIEIIPEEQRPVYIALTSTIQFPFTLLSFLGGVIASYVGFLGVFAAVAVFMAATFIASLKLESGK